VNAEAPEPPPSAGRRAGRFAETGAAALLWAALVIGSAVLTLCLPVYTSAASQWLEVSNTAGLPPADVLRLSGQVRALVVDDEFDPLPSTFHGSPAFDSAAVSHLMDVRAVLADARLATGIAALLLATYTGLCVTRGRVDRLRAGMRAAAVVCMLLVVLAVVAALTDFSSFFAGFHGLFFKSGTWTFPADSLLIRLFPERFWEAAGAVWGALVLLGGGVLLAASRLTRAAQARLFASRTGNNV
jgi:integral membrane protein (TIGR01906 family)